MMEGVSMPTPVPQWLPNPKTSLLTGCGLLATHCTAKEGWMVDCPTLSGNIGVEIIPPQKNFHGSNDYQEVRKKKWLPWPLLFRTVLLDLEHSQECYVEQCRSSTNALPLSLRETVSWAWRCWILWRKTLWLPLPWWRAPMLGGPITTNSPTTDGWNGGACLFFFARLSIYAQTRGGGTPSGTGPGAK